MFCVIPWAVGGRSVGGYVLFGVFIYPMVRLGRGGTLGAAEKGVSDEIIQEKNRTGH